MVVEIEEVVCSINTTLFECVGDVYTPRVTYTGDGYETIVYFGDTQVWRSEDDEREDINEDGDKEPLEGFLRKEISKLLRTLKPFELALDTP